MAFLRIALGYLAACLLGAVAAGSLVEFAHPNGTWLRSVLIMIPIALVVCLPTFIAGRLIIRSSGPALWYHHVLLWTAAGSLPPLIIAPGEIGIFAAIVLLPFGALAGVLAYFVEGRRAEVV